MLPFVPSAYFQNLLDGYPESVIIFNTDGYAYACNHRARDLLCIAGDEDFKGRLWDELLPGIDDQNAFLQYVHASHYHPDKRPPLEAGYTLDDGTRLRLSLATSLLVEYHKVFGILLSMTDVTHIYSMYERQRRFLEERHAMERERAQSLTQLPDAVAHQLRNPAMAIAGFARIALRRADNDLHEYLDGILEESMRLESIVRAVASFNAIRSSKPERILITELVARAVGEALRRGPGTWRAIPLIVDVEETAVTIDVELAIHLLPSSQPTPRTPCARWSRTTPFRRVTYTSARAGRKACASRWRTPVPAFQQTSCTTSSTPSSPRNRTAWAWA